MDSGFYSVLLLFITLINFSAQAGIVVSGTRVIYPADKKEVTVSMKNTGQSPALVQSWIDTGDPTEAPQNITVPFVLMPPFARIDGGKGQTLRLMYTGGALPKDRESVFWLNILSVPPKKTDPHNQYLNVAYQTRIKLFYRPEKLTGQAEMAARKMKWKIERGALHIHNPTPYYISILNAKWLPVNDYNTFPGGMVAPFGHLKLESENLIKQGEVKRLIFNVINDQGMVLDFNLSVDDA